MYSIKHFSLQQVLRSLVVHFLIKVLPQYLQVASIGWLQQLWCVDVGTYDLPQSLQILGLQLGPGLPMILTSNNTYFNALFITIHGN